MNFYKRFIGDIQRDTGHLSLSEFGAYDRLLDHYYATEQPLPLDIDACCRIARAMTRDERKAVSLVLSQFFTNSDVGYIQKRAEQELAEAQPKIEANRLNGAKGGRPKGTKNKTQEKPNGFSEETQSEPNDNLSHSHSQNQNTHLSNSSEKSNVPSVVDFPISPKGLICKALVQGGVINFNAANPKLDKLVEAGVTVEEIVETAQEIRLKSPDKLKFDYLVSVVIGRRSDAQQMTIAPKVDNSPPWYHTAKGIEAKAIELGLDVESMTFPYLKIEVFKLAGVTDEMVRKASQDYPQNRKTA